MGRLPEVDFPFSISHFSFAISIRGDTAPLLVIILLQWKLINVKWKMENPLLISYHFL